MIQFDIKNSKKIMGDIFIGDFVDDLYVVECEIHMMSQINIDGKKCKKWFVDEAKDKVGSEAEDKAGNEAEDKVGSENECGIYCKWKQLKEMVYNIIKGKKTPSFLKIVFVENENDIKTGVLNLKYQDEKVFLTTGYICREFILDKSFEKEWDIKISQIIENNNY